MSLIAELIFVRDLDFMFVFCFFAFGPHLIFFITCKYHSINEKLNKIIVHIDQLLTYYY
jgi:hypothetical protein